MPATSSSPAAGSSPAAAGTGSFAAGDLLTNLERVKRAGAQHRLNVSGTAFALGVALIVVGVLLQQVLSVGVRPAVATAALGPMFHVPGILMTMLALFPTDRTFILVAYAIGLLYSCVNCQRWAGVLSNALASVDECRVPTDDDAADAAKRAPRSLCEWKVTQSTLAVCWYFFCIGCYTYVLVRRRRISSRELLRRLWIVITISCYVIAALFLVDAVADCATPAVRRTFTAGELALRFLACAVIGAGGVGSASARFRAGAQAALERLAQRATGRDDEDAVAAAAGVAALLGGHSADEVAQKGRERFNAIGFADLDYEELADNKPNPALFERAKPTRLGEVDAFLSHSWSDPPRTKWAAWQKWREAFIAKQGREPRVWLDKCCIDQRDIESNLMCLPVFVAGCRRMLIACGPTYLQRLWCVMELFTFLNMGGSLDRIDLLLLDAPAVSDKEERVAADAEGSPQWFREFDVGLAHCRDPEQREKLLGIIESGFVGG